MGSDAPASLSGSATVRPTDPGETPTLVPASADSRTSRQADTEAISLDASAGQIQLSREVDESATITDAATPEFLPNVLQRNAVVGDVPSTGAGQEKTLRKLSARMEKKLRKQGNEIDFRNNTPLELFFMIMAGAGLVLGIFGIGLGWFVFIVAGGIWLYYKLVVNKK